MTTRDRLAAVRLPTHCPKCQRERRPAEDACARCGLLVARWEGFQVEFPSFEPVDTAWAELLKAWEDDGAHRRFLDGAAHAGGLDVAAARYRQILRERPADPRAEGGLRRAASLAENLCAGRAREARAGMPLGLVRVLGLAGAIAVVLGAIWTVFMLAKR